MGRLVVLLACLALGSASLARGDGPMEALWTVHGDGSARRLVTPVAGGRVLDIGASRLAVQTADGISVSGFDGGGGVVLPDSAGADYAQAALSPTGAQVAYVLWARGGHRLYVANVDGTAAHEVDPSASLATWSPDGRTIYFASGPPDAVADLDAERADGSGRRVLVRRVVTYPESAPAVSPDGRSVAYDCVNVDGGGFCVDTGGKVRRYPHGGFDPIWSPTGHSVATTIIGDITSGVAVVDLATGRRTIEAPVPDLLGVSYTPLAWSPDGRRLLVQRRCDGTAVGECSDVVYVRALAAGTQRRLSFDALAWIDVRWRGSTITYVTQP